MAVYRLVECKKGFGVDRIEILSTTHNINNSKSDVWLSVTLLDTYVEDNGNFLNRKDLFELIKDNSFYLYDLLVNEQQEVIELAVNRLCDNGCLIEQRRFISQGKP